MRGMTLVVAGALVTAAAGAVRAAPCTSSDAEARAAIERAGGHLGPHVSFQRSAVLPELVVAFDPDGRGLRWRPVLACRAGDAAHLQAAVLARAGWARADAATRTEIALAWLELGEQAHPLTRTDGADIAPVGRPTSDGGFVLRYWVATVERGAPGTTLVHYERRFDRRGRSRPPRELERRYLGDF